MRRRRRLAPPISNAVIAGPGWWRGRSWPTVGRPGGRGDSRACHRWRAPALAVALVTFVTWAVPAAAAQAAGTASPGTASPGLGTLGPLVRRTASYPGAPPGSTPLGTVPASTTVSLGVVLSLPDPAAVAAEAAAVSTPGNPAYRHYLAPGQFEARYGPTASTVASVDAWLRGEGFRPSPVVGNLIVPFRASAGAAERAFGLRLQRSRLPSGRLARVPSASPLVPSGLTGSVVGIAGLDTVAKATSQALRPSAVSAAGTAASRAIAGSSGAAAVAPASGAARARVLSHQVPGAASACPSAAAATAPGGYTDNQLAAAYQFPALYQAGQLGQGVTIAAVELEPFAPSDLAAFESCYGIGTQVSVVPVDGGAGTGSGQGEAALDVEELAALAPDASVLAYEAPNTNVGTDEDYTTIAKQDRAQVITTSWGACEALAAPDMAAETTAFEEATIQGQTVLAASGDSGSEDCFIAGYDTNGNLAVDDPGSQPWVTSVGGTSLLATSPTTGAAASQTVWNDCQGILSTTGQPTSCANAPGGQAGASGGGISSVWAMPTYQSAAGLATAVPGDSGRGCTDAAGTFGPASGVCRTVPDVSADADPSTGVTVVYQGNWQILGGTSMASPLWAALAALADSGCATTVGELNTRLYPLATSSAGPSLFTDITSGDNDLTGTNGGQYPATTGYDLATGWGTPVASALVAALQPAGGCPVVSGLSATSGLARGGSPATLTITGAHLAGATAVHFGSVAATSFSVGSSGTTITVTPPPGAAGPVAVTVTTPNGTSGASAAATFDYVGPVVTGVSPASGPPRGGQRVTVSGSGFAPGGSGAGTSVAFGGTPATSVTVLSDGSLTAVAPAHPAGVVDVVVTTADGQSGTGPADHFVYTGGGYRLVAADGGIFAFGGASFQGSTGGMVLNKPIVGMAATPTGGGYWLVASDGGVFAFGDASFYGSTGGMVLNKPIVGMAATPSGGGYWLVASDGGVFAFGDAGYFGSVPGLPPAERTTEPVVALVGTPDGNGYWEVNSAGDVYSFGDASFYGSTGALTLSKPIVGMAATPTGGGYWLVASDGGVFAFGDASFYGSTGGMVLNKPIVGMAATPSGGGYWLVASDGGVFAFGDARFDGSTGGITLNQPIVGMSAG